MILLGAAAPSAISFHGEEPLVLEFTGDAGDAWAVAIRSHDQPTSYQGNEIFVTIWANPPYERSITSMGIIELKLDEEDRLEARRGAVGTVFRGEDEIHVTPLGDLPGAVEPEFLRTEGPAPSEEAIGGMTERRFMETGEWRYFVVWAAGSETSTFRLRGQGFTVEKIVHGEGSAFGNDELVAGGGVHAHRTIGLPPGTSHGDDGYVGAGVTSVSDTGVTLGTSAPLIGVFTEFDRWDLCVSGCKRVGNTADDAASRVQAGGFANFSMVTPERGPVWNEQNLYWLMPQDIGSTWFSAATPGDYAFRIEHLTDVSGPWYQDPLRGTGVRFDGEQVVLSLGEVDYLRLEGLETM